MKEMNKPSVTVLIPTLNEEGSISGVIQKLNQMGYRDIWVIDGNSRDRTVEFAKELGVNIIIQNGKGKGNALREAFNHAAENGRAEDAIVIMDADGSMDPKDIPSFMESLGTGADMAKGSRFLPKAHSEDMSSIRRAGNLLFTLMVNLFWSARYTDLCYGFAAFRKDAINRLYPHLKSANFEIETEIFIKARKLGLKVIEVPSIEYRRRYGKSNLNTLGDGFRIFRTIIEEFVDHP